MKVELHKEACAAEKAANIAARASEIRRVASLTDDPVIQRWLERLVHFLPHRQRRGRAGRNSIEAGKKAGRDSQDKTKEVAERRRHWTEAERANIMSADARDEDLALSMGRTLYSIRSMRRKLYRLGSAKCGSGCGNYAEAVDRKLVVPRA